MKSFKVVFFVLLLCLDNIYAQISIAKLTLAEFDRVENDYMSKLKKESIQKGLPTKEFNQELTNIAQIEADRLASIQKLEFPLVDLSKKNYYGFSREIIGKVQINKSWKLVGRIMCHDNISKRDFIEKLNINLYDINKGCAKIDTKHGNGYQYGYGRAISKNGTLYHVRLFFQKI